jgi:5,10-methylenetetrahydromethanopterin reductase
MKINLGRGLHWTADMSYADLVADIEETEALGYDQLWISNEKFFRDMYVVAGVAAERTRRIQIGTFVVDPYTHHPALTAMSLATLDAVSGGRAILGIGAGGTGLPVIGVQRTKPPQAIKEAVQVIRELWAGKTVDFEGQVIHCRNGRLNVPPEHSIPVIVDSRGDKVLQMGGEIGDGVMIATYAEPSGIRYAMSMIEKGARRAGRELKDVRIISRVDAAVALDRRAAIDAVKPMVGVFLWTSYPDRSFVHQVGLKVPEQLEELIAKRDYNLMAPNAHLVPDEFVDKFCWAGTAEEVAQKVAEVVKLGIADITFLPHPPAGGTVRETLRAFAQVIKPMVEEMTSRFQMTGEEL